MQVSSGFRAAMVALFFIASVAAVRAQQPTPEAHASAAPVSASASASPSPSPSPVPPYNRLAFREIGPALSGGRVTSVVGVADDPKLYYLGSAGGGVWKTVNGGATWTKVPAPVFANLARQDAGGAAAGGRHIAVSGGAPSGSSGFPVGWNPKCW